MLISICKKSTTCFFRTQKTCTNENTAEQISEEVFHALPTKHTCSEQTVKVHVAVSAQLEPGPA